MREGLRVPGRPFPLPDGEGPKFRRLIDLAGARVGNGELRRLGFQCGSSTARAFEANILSPSEGAARMVAAFEAACGAAGWKSKADGERGFELRLAFTPPASASFRAFTGGFVKGAATRLNEGVVPSIHPGEDGPRAWSAKVEWGAGKPSRAPKGGRRTPHK